MDEEQKDSIITNNIAEEPKSPDENKKKRKYHISEKRLSQSDDDWNLTISMVKNPKTRRDYLADREHYLKTHTPIVSEERRKIDDINKYKEELSKVVDKVYDPLLLGKQTINKSFITEKPEYEKTPELQIYRPFDASKQVYKRTDSNTQILEPQIKEFSFEKNYRYKHILEVQFDNQYIEPKTIKFSTTFPAISDSFIEANVIPELYRRNAMNRSSIYEGLKVVSYRIVLTWDNQRREKVDFISPAMPY